MHTWHLEDSQLKRSKLKRWVQTSPGPKKGTPGEKAGGEERNWLVIQCQESWPVTAWNPRWRSQGWHLSPSGQSKEGGQDRRLSRELQHVPLLIWRKVGKMFTTIIQVHLMKAGSYPGYPALPRPPIWSISGSTWILYIFIHFFCIFMAALPGQVLSHPSQLKSLLSGPPKFIPGLPLTHSPHCRGPPLKRTSLVLSLSYVKPSWVPGAPEILYTSTQDLRKASPRDPSPLDTQSKQSLLSPLLSLPSFYSSDTPSFLPPPNAYAIP